MTPASPEKILWDSINSLRFSIEEKETKDKLAFVDIVTCEWV